MARSCPTATRARRPRLQLRVVVRGRGGEALASPRQGPALVQRHLVVLALAVAGAVALGVVAVAARVGVVVAGAGAAAAAERGCSVARSMAHLWSLP